MAFKATSYWRAMLNRVGPNRHFATATKPKLFAATMDAAHADSRHLGSSIRAEFAPIYVLAGMLTVAIGIGMHTMKQQLVHSPGVRVNKKKRETMPEVEDPEYIIDSADKFVNKSFLRKVAHIQDPNKRTLHDPVRPNPFTKARDADTLKSVGVDPARR